ncbi:hypothetical protein HY992_04240 [Candidatus Micrarchaeota archaeon]|nr:hypothetical protein [Candidatus Micrarchaeota archaeon]
MNKKHFFKGNFFSKGQFFSIDFVLALALFSLVVLSIAFAWEDVRAQASDFQAHAKIYSTAEAVSDSLVRSKGFPANWSAGDVQSIGLASEARVLNESKAGRLLELNYAVAKSKLGAWEYEFYFNLTDSNGSIINTGTAKPPVAYFLDEGGVLWQKLNGSGLEWDLYYSSASGDVEDADYRHAYRGSGPSNALELLLANESSYKTIVLEAHSVKSTHADMQQLEEFLNEGGLVLQFGTSNGNFLLENFSMHYEFAGGSERNGTVVNNAGVLDAQIGDVVEFTNPVYALRAEENDSTLTLMIVNSANESKAFAGMWSYGSGKIYFVGDVGATVNEETDFYEVIDFVGRMLEYGLKPTTAASDVIVVRRVAILENDMSRQIANMQLLVWK